MEREQERKEELDSLRGYRSGFYGIAYACEHLDIPLKRIHVKTPRDFGQNLMNGMAGVQKGTTAGIIDMGWKDDQIEKLEIYYCTSPRGEPERWEIKASGEFTAERDLYGWNGGKILTYVYRNRSSCAPWVIGQLREVIQKLSRGEDVEFDLALPTR